MRRRRPRARARATTRTTRSTTTTRSRRARPTTSTAGALRKPPGAAAAAAAAKKGAAAPPGAPVDADEVVEALDGPNKAQWDAVKPEAGPLAGQPDAAGPAAWGKVDADTPKDDVDPRKVAAKDGFAKGAADADADAGKPVKWFVAEPEQVAAQKAAADKKKKQPQQKRSLFGGKDEAAAPAEVKAASTAGTKRRRLDKRRPRSLPNNAFPNAIAKILVNPRCVTTYAGVSHTQLALDLFGSGEDREPTVHEGGKYVLDEWRTAPESFVCQEMRTTGGASCSSSLSSALLELSS